jgi:NAD+ kinase
MPPLKPKSVLLVFKKSLYQIYVLEGRAATPDHAFAKADLARYHEAHTRHLASLAMVEEVLKDLQIRYRKVYRARRVDYSPHDMVIAVGGDGTVLEAARTLKHQPILGVNSDPERSYGHFTCATGKTFRTVMTNLLVGRQPTKILNRMELLLDGRLLPVTVLNDLLIAHQCPCAMSRYTLGINEIEEEQRGSGLWISTAGGSSGAIHSAGGKLMRLGSKRLQYRPRELFTIAGMSYQLTGGIMDRDPEIRVTSRMREGVIFLDGSHYRVSFGLGQQLTVHRARNPLRLVLRSEDQLDPDPDEQAD